jgi:molybdate transport system substrate-binding protein
VRLSFAGSDELATQIRQGARPDVYAAANTKLPRQLNSEGLLTTPVEFATNRLVVAVPKGSAIRSLRDLGKPGVPLAIGSKSVPVGSYTRQALARLPKSLADSILANVRSNEPDVKGIVGKLTQRAVGAGFVYASDVRASSGRLRAVTLPTGTRPTVVYAAGVVKGAPHAGLGRRYVSNLARGRCHDALLRAGFGKLK